MKSELRIIYKENIKSLSHSLKSDLDKKIFINLGKVLTQFKCKSIGMYAALADEPLWDKSTFAHYAISYPLYDKKSFEISYCSLKENVELENYKFPSEMSLENVVPEVLISPSLGFSRKGYRVGRGKGSFDRYLKDFSGLKIGLSYEMNLLDFAPESHDECFDIVITENEVIKI